jgi:hypothetical protein
MRLFFLFAFMGVSFVVPAGTIRQEQLGEQTDESIQLEKLLIPNVMMIGRVRAAPGRVPRIDGARAGDRFSQIATLSTDKAWRPREK